MQKLQGKKVALLVSSGFEQSELVKPREAIQEAGGTVVIVSPEDEKVKGWQKKDWGDTFEVDQALASAAVEDFDALVLPGGQMNPDNLRTNETAIRFIRGFVASGKPIAAICHGPWTLIEAGAVKGRRMTSYASIKTDLTNAGAEWVDESCVVDGNLITSRKPDDLEDFCCASSRLSPTASAASAWGSDRPAKSNGQHRA